MHPQTQQLTALCLMNTAKAAREDIGAGRITQARRHILTLYHIALYAGSSVICQTAVEEIMRLESDINAFHLGESYRAPRIEAEIIPFPDTNSGPDLPPSSPSLSVITGFAA